MSHVIYADNYEVAGIICQRESKEYVKHGEVHQLRL